MHDLPSGLTTFLEVADTGSFTAAATRLGVSPSAVSQQVRTLEQRIGVRLLHRTTRSARLTEAGERYRAEIAPAVAHILAAERLLETPEAVPSGVLKLSLPRTAFMTLIRPVLSQYLARYPQVQLELSIDNMLIDIVKDGFDAGIRFGHLIQQDMVALPIGREMRIAYLAAPSYLDKRGRPKKPDDLAGHACIAFRNATHGTIEPWAFVKGGKETKVVPEGPLIVSSTEALIAALEDGLGIGSYVAEFAGDALKDGKLERVLSAWSPPLAGFHLYYPSRRGVSNALRALISIIKEGKPHQS